MLRYFSIIFILFFVSLPAFAEDSLIQTSAREAIVVDYDTGAVLLEKNADNKMPTSSMSKIMTMYMVFDAIKQGQLSTDTQFTVSEKAWRVEGSKMFIEVGKQVAVGDLMQGVIVQSGNDAAMVLAEGVAGSEDVFAGSMNKKAQELGMKNSHFANASGLPDPNHYSTARDMAILARATIRDFPEYYKLYAEKEFTYNNIKQGNRNPLLYLNIGADGIKTGHAEEAGYGLVGSGMMDGRRVILVVNGLADMKERAEESGKLLEWGLKNFANRKFFAPGETVATAKIAMGQVETVPLVVKENIAVTLPKISADDYKVTVNYKEPLIAPIVADQQVGTVKVEIPHMPAMEMPLYTGQSVPRLGVFAGAVKKAKIFFTGS